MIISAKIAWFALASFQEIRSERQLDAKEKKNCFQENDIMGQEFVYTSAPLHLIFVYNFFPGMCAEMQKKYTIKHACVCSMQRTANIHTCISITSSNT